MTPGAIDTSSATTATAITPAAMVPPPNRRDRCRSWVHSTTAITTTATAMRDLEQGLDGIRVDEVEHRAKHRADAANPATRPTPLGPSRRHRRMAAGGDIGPCRPSPRSTSPSGLVTQIIEDEVPDLAAGLAYRFLFAIFPFAIFLAALAGVRRAGAGHRRPDQRDPRRAVRQPPARRRGRRSAPQLEAVLGTTRPGLLSIGAVTALWAATGGVGAVIKGMNKAYDVEETRGLHRADRPSPWA